MEPSDELVVRQDWETEIPEVCGIPCSNFQVYFISRNPINVGVMFLRLEEKWHRFFLDACCLFWHEGRAPDPENDLEDGDDYVDWGAQLGVVGVALSEVTMKDCVLTVRFENGAELVLKDDTDEVTTSILSFKPGTDSPSVLH